ncbi:TPA: hypothetical protein ENS27_11215 [bacterium]|nr:hypothetical protein [bacterium]
MELKYINRTDLIIVGMCILFILISLINIAFGSVILLYLADITTLGVMTYWGIKNDSTKRLLKSLIVGGIVGVLMTFLETLFVEVSIVTYLRKNSDLVILSTPLSVVLFWIFFISAMMYIYQRLRSSFSRFYIPSLLTGITAFLLGLILIYLGDRSRQWVWSVGADPKPMPSIGPVPLYVPLAFFITFLLSPYIIGVSNDLMTKDQTDSVTKFFKISNNPLVAGIRCAIVLSASMYGLLMIFNRLQLYM